MSYLVNFRMLIVSLLAIMVLCWTASCKAANPPLTRLASTLVTATQYAPDGKELGKTPELTDGNASTRWLYRPSATPENDLPLRLVFDMGSACTVGKVRIANYGNRQNYDRGIKLVDIFVGDILAPATGGTPAAANIQVKMSDATGPAWTDIALAQAVKGRYVTVRVQSNWGGNAYAANEVELYTTETNAPNTPATVLTPPQTTAQGPLSVRITSPTINAEVGGNAGMTLTAVVTSPAGTIAKVEFLDDDQLIGAATQAPYTLTYQPAVAKLNHSFTAKVSDAAGHTAQSSPVNCVASSKLPPHQYKTYAYEETAENMLKQVRLSIPEGLTTIRGILVVSNGSGGDTRTFYNEVWYSEFLYLHGFAFLGAKGFSSHVESVQVLLHALQQMAKDSNHPELLNVPFVTTGFSAGGGFASRLLVELPDRVIASVPVSARLNFTGITVSAAIQQTPALVISGELEKFEQAVEPNLATYRPQGALFGWMTVQGAGHARYGQEILAMPLLDTAVRLRYPANGDVRQSPLKLKTLDPASGWIADNTTWKSGLVTIAPAKQFKGDITRSSWLPSEDIAFIYRAFGSYDKPLSIPFPSVSLSSQRVWDAGSNFTIMVDTSKFPGWKTMEFFDGAQKLGEITQGPAQFTAMNLTAGYHVFSVLGTDAAGSVRPSNPVMVVVRNVPK